MKRTSDEVKRLGTDLVNRIVADMITQFPQLRAAVDRLPRAKWVGFVDELCHATGESLLTAFGSADT
jgi:hypothetical protein